MKYCIVVAVILTALTVANAGTKFPDFGERSNNQNIDGFLASTEKVIGMADHSKAALANSYPGSPYSGAPSDASANRPPAFSPVPAQYVLEGDTLKLNIQATDPDLNPIALTLASSPPGATFTPGAAGAGRLTWVPAYIGPTSSDGSPFSITVLASDGHSTTTLTFSVAVLNRNRAPKLTAPTQVTVAAGQPLAFSVSVTEPDFETVTWKVLGKPFAAYFDDGTPGHFTWTPPITDSGTKVIEFIAADPSGLADTAGVAVHVLATSLYTLAINAVPADIGDTVTSTISLDNRFPITGFNLLVNYDPTALSIDAVSRTSTRIDYFEYFSATLNDGGRPGHVRIIGTARLTGSAGPLAAGNGPIVNIRFRTAANLDLSGLAIPIKFVNLDLAHDDNTLSDSVGVKIPQTSIAYANGEVDFNSIGTVKIGDINLNGIPYEIGDAIYFTNFFINPVKTNFSLLQYANSDINGDGILATVADLVKLITIIVSGQPGQKVAAAESLDAILAASTTDAGTTFSYQTTFPVGGVLFDIETNDVVSPQDIVSGDPNMTVDFRQDGRELRVLIYSMQGWSMAAGTQSCLTISGLNDCLLKSADLASADGRLARVTMTGASPTVPNDFALKQNYPNPFNPETTIEFELPGADRVSLTVFDLLGREVRSLAEGGFTAGQHRVTWDGRDSRGEAVASGLYLYRLETSKTSLSRKMMLLK